MLGFSYGAKDGNITESFPGLKYLQVSHPQWFSRIDIYCPQAHILMNPGGN